MNNCYLDFLKNKVKILTLLTVIYVSKCSEEKIICFVIKIMHSNENSDEDTLSNISEMKIYMDRSMKTSLMKAMITCQSELKLQTLIRGKIL
jgi:hypothetical protein